MRTLVHFQIAELQPTIGEVLEAQGLPEAGALAPRLRRLVEDAFAVYTRLAEPRAVYQEIEPGAFEAVLAPLALASDALVIGRVSRRAHALALYVATLGSALPDRIRRLFADNDLAEGYMLDALASAGAELLSDRLSSHYASARAARGGASAERTLAYSPGYCGWPTAGQRALFAALAPEEVGVTLNDSCLMTPVKSVSGVLVSAPAEAHRFRPDFPFCRACRRRECGRRMASVLEPAAAIDGHAGATPEGKDAPESPGAQ